MTWDNCGLVYSDEGLRWGACEEGETPARGTLGLRCFLFLRQEVKQSLGGRGAGVRSEPSVSRSRL